MAIISQSSTGTEYICHHRTFYQTEICRVGKRRFTVVCKTQFIFVLLLYFCITTANLTLTLTLTPPHVQSIAGHFYWKSWQAIHIHAVLVSTATVTTLKFTWLTNKYLPSSLACRADSGRSMSAPACSLHFSFRPGLQGSRHSGPAISEVAHIVFPRIPQAKQGVGPTPSSGWVMTCPLSVGTQEQEVKVVKQ